MIIEKLIMPYVLASQHPIIHVTSFITSIFFFVFEEESLEAVWEEQEDLKTAFMATVSNNVICLFLHLLSNALTRRMIT